MPFIERAKQFWSRYASSWRELPLGTIAVVLALLVLLSPEMAALGIDATFFDALVLLMSVQLQINYRSVRIGINALCAATVCGVQLCWERLRA